MPPASRAAATGQRARRLRGDKGAVTVEAALGVCAVVIVLALALAGVAAVLSQLRCTDAAREAARLAARGEADRAPEAVQQIAPKGAHLALHTEGDTVRVEVTDQPSPLLPGLTIRAEAYAVLEPGTPQGGTE
ncbi:hypothetical protein GCM10012275_15120 [Longimycelium tulufanense]|uniref:Pilus assembly protein TadE n=1 Tax=Longimycelium tulufanense TaxID=907463 RepID=A0A8J3FTD4_9PSEU|nr:TadE family type IV pilus minor pilin [Longimycelium tulufanense]GGM45049.1 hypothetical protein GCM10012275_15120 [Longimycelium tulufanense]